MNTKTSKYRFFKKSNIPNLLTISRLLWIIPVVVLISLTKSESPVYQTTIWNNHASGPDLKLLLAGVFFVVGCVSDFLDGYLSRKYNWVSAFGKLWDPIADKVLVNAVMICFIWKQYLPFWVLIINMFRDICVEGFRQYAIAHQIDIAAGKLGKWKTTTQMLGLLTIFFIFNLPYSEVTTNYEQITFWIFQNGFILISLVLSLVSGWIYLVRFYWKAS